MSTEFLIKAVEGFLYKKITKHGIGDFIKFINPLTCIKPIPIGELNSAEFASDIYPKI